MSNVTKTQASSTGPRCPNHNCPLILSPGEKRLKKGAAPCAISKVLFEYTQDTMDGSTKKDKFGNIINSFSVSGPENG